MYGTKAILPEIEIFADKLINHEEIYNCYPYNIPKFVNPLTSNIKTGNNTITFKEAISQPDMLEFMEAMRKLIGANEDCQY